MIEMFERADREPDALQRVPLLSFVIAGGGFAGVKLAVALLAWLMWRAIYFSKLPGMEIRVRMDWMIELFFPRDIDAFSGGSRAINGRVVPSRRYHS